MKEKKTPHAGSDAEMRSEGADPVIKTFDLVVDLINYFKNEVIANAKREDILNADLIIYMLTKSIKVYGKYRSALDNEAVDRKINDSLIEIIESTITSADHNILLGKTKSCETVFVLIETMNSLLSFYDKQPINLVKRNRPDRSHQTTSKDRGTSKDIPRSRMRTQIIFNFIEQIKARKDPDADEPAIVQWLSSVIEKFIPYFVEGKGSIIIPKNIDRPVVCEENETDNVLLKIHNKEPLWRWSNILTSLSLTTNRFFDVEVFNSWFEPPLKPDPLRTLTLQMDSPP